MDRNMATCLLSGRACCKIALTEKKLFKGTIILYEVIDGQKIRKVTDLKVKGACRSLAMCDGKIVAGLVKSVSRLLCLDDTHMLTHSPQVVIYGLHTLHPIPTLDIHNFCPHKTRHLPHLYQPT